jgi:hypothetical protein
MKIWMKQILLTQNIGGIVIALLVVSAFLDVVRAITLPITVMAQNWGQSRMSENDFRQYRFLLSQVGVMVIGAVLFLLAAYLLAVWLFGAPPEALPNDEMEEPQGGDAA